LGEGRFANGEVLSGTYRIVRLVGKGGAGEVYEAVHQRLSKKRLAVKVLLAEFSKREEVLERFQREADLLSALNHPNIVEISDLSHLSDGTPFLVMEFLDGANLAEEVHRHGPMRLDRVVDVVGQVASALDAVHSQQIIHRDLKPQNLVLTHRTGDQREIVKILDFGIAKVREATIGLTRQDTIIGTPQYMAPEQASPQHGEVDERSDQYSLAAIAYELVTGRAPFSGDSSTAILYQVVHEPPLPFREPMPEMERVILRGLAKRKTDRFRSVREFHEALVRAAEIDKAAATPPVAPTLQLTEHAKLSPKQEPTAILPPTTTLSEAAAAVAPAPSAEKSTSSRGRHRFVLGLAVLVAGGVLVMTLWSRVRPTTRSREPRENSSAFVAPAQPDARPNIAPAVLAAPDAPPITMPAVRRAEDQEGLKRPAKKPGHRKKDHFPGGGLKMEDL
jgi:eukaryotic-like serine/threonine-protein kinase